MKDDEQIIVIIYILINLHCISMIVWNITTHSKTTNYNIHYNFIINFMDIIKTWLLVNK